MSSFDAAEVPVNIQYRYRPREYGDQLVRMYLLTNDGESNLGAAPLPDGVVRIETMRTEWRIEPDGEQTRARYRYQGEMSGLARWMPRIGVQARSRAVLDGLADELARRADTD